MTATAFWLGDKQYVVETATDSDKAELKASNPTLYEQYFKDSPVKDLPVEDSVENEIPPKTKNK